MYNLINLIIRILIKIILNNFKVFSSGSKVASNWKGDMIGVNGIKRSV